MRAALLCREPSGVAAATMRLFAEQGNPIVLALLETDERTRFSRTERDFAAAHEAFERRVSDAPGPGPVRRAWRALPAGIRAGVKSAIRTARGTVGPVEQCARELGTPLVEVARHSSAHARAALESHDVGIVLLAASAWLIREPLLSMTAGIVNAHPAKLPEHRSLDALPWSILAGDPVGLTAHLIDAGVDTGPILRFAAVAPQPGEGLVTLRARLDEHKPALFLDVVRGLDDGSIAPAPQRAEDGVHHRPMTVEELLAAEAVLADGR